MFLNIARHENILLLMAIKKFLSLDVATKVETDNIFYNTKSVTFGVMLLDGSKELYMPAVLCCLRHTE